MTQIKALSQRPAAPGARAGSRFDDLIFPQYRSAFRYCSPLAVVGGVTGHEGGASPGKHGAIMLKADTRQYALTGDHDLPVAVPLMPSTPRHRAIAVGVVVTLFALAAVVAPFAQIQIGRIDSFVPVLQTVLSAADLLTATLLFAQYSVQPRRELLAVASGYLFSASFAFLQTLSFPGGYGPSGIIGDGYDSPAWFFVLWHTTFSLSILTYALLKDSRKTSDISTTASVVIALPVYSGQ